MLNWAATCAVKTASTIVLFLMVHCFSQRSNSTWADQIWVMNSAISRCSRPLPPESPSLPQLVPSMTESIHADLNRDGFVCIRLEKSIAAEIQIIADCVSTVATSSSGDVNDGFDSMVEQLSCGLRNRDDFARQWVQSVLLVAHDSVGGIHESLVPRLAQLAAQLGMDVDSN